MSYADDLVRQWELNDPRDRWRHTGERPPSAHAQSKALEGWKPTEDQERDIDRMLVCDVCGADACAGFGVSLDAVKMGDVGSWRCAEHHPQRQPSYTREEWAKINADQISRETDQPIIERAAE